MIIRSINYATSAHENIEIDDATILTIIPEVTMRTKVYFEYMMQNIIFTIELAAEDSLTISRIRTRGVHKKSSTTTFRIIDLQNFPHYTALAIHNYFKNDENALLGILSTNEAEREVYQSFLRTGIIKCHLR